MRTAIFTFKGTVAAGDLLMLSYYAARGGRSTAKVFIADPPGEAGRLTERTDDAVRKSWKTAMALPEAINVLAAEINSPSSEWSPGAGDFKATVNGDRLMVMCSTLTDDVKFVFGTEGSNSTTCEVEVLG